MIATLTRRLALLSITLGLFGSAVGADVQPRMEKAIELLEKAKTDAKPVPLLEKAKEHVQNAPANKGGARPKAIKAIDAAIETANSGKSAVKKIDLAIEALKAGAEHAK